MRTLTERKPTPIRPIIPTKVVVWMDVRNPQMLREIMKTKGFGPSSLGRAAGVTHGMIGHLLAGRKGCSPGVAHKIAGALEVPQELLFVTNVSRAA